MEVSFLGIFLRNENDIKLLTGEMELSFLGHFFKEQINNTKFLTGRMEVSFLGKILIGDFLFGIVFESQNTKN